VTNKTARQLSPLDAPGGRAHPAQGRPAGPDHQAGTGGAVSEFERLYRGNVDAVTAYFARRTADPQTVADLTADTFVAAITSIATFDPGRGTARAWVFGIARRVYAAHCEAHAQHNNRVIRLAGRRELDTDQVEELLDRIDAERAGRRLVSELTALPEPDRAVIELVDLAGLKPAEAAVVLRTSAGAVRMRLMRARGRLRRAGADTTEQTTKGDDHE
jgi:RNA polymerase sigma-70 factor (ECF subfamily)